MASNDVRIADVARLAGVSTATVSRVLSQKPHVREEVRQRVLDTARQLGYQPSRIAQSLRTQRARIIGLIVSDIQNPFFTRIARAVEDLAIQHGYAVFLCNSDESPEKEQMYIDLLIAERVTGIIMSPTRANSTAYQTALAAGIPAIAIDRKPKGGDIDTVITDNSEASYTLVNHLIAAGRQRIAGVFSDLDITTGAERFQGYQQALQEAGLWDGAELVLTGKPIEADGYNLTQQLLEGPPRPDALLCGTHLMAVGALRAIFDRGVQIPDEIALAMFDRLEWLPLPISMTVAQQPTYALGEMAVKLLLERIATPNKPVQHVTLVSQIATLP